MTPRKNGLMCRPDDILKAECPTRRTKITTEQPMMVR